VKARVAASAVLALAVALGTTGCNLFAPQATTELYDPSDGVGGSVGRIDVRNAIIVTEGIDGTIGNLVVTLVNNDTKSHRVSISAGENGATAVSEVTVQPGQITLIGTEPTKASSSNVFLRNFSALPGSLYPVYFQYGDETGVQLRVPILDGSLQEYTDLVPPTVAPF
jgi:hypothetical protein